MTIFFCQDPFGHRFPKNSHKYRRLQDDEFWSRDDPDFDQYYGPDPDVFAPPLHPGDRKSRRRHGAKGEDPPEHRKSSLKKERDRISAQKGQKLLEKVIVKVSLLRII